MHLEEEVFLKFQMVLLMLIFQLKFSGTDSATTFMSVYYKTEPVLL